MVEEVSTSAAGCGQVTLWRVSIAAAVDRLKEEFPSFADLVQPFTTALSTVCFSVFVFSPPARVCLSVNLLCVCMSVCWLVFVCLFAGLFVCLCGTIQLCVCLSVSKFRGSDCNGQKWYYN